MATAQQSLSERALGSAEIRIIGSIDRLYLGLISLVFLCVVLVIPPARNFPMYDDWIYVRSVDSLLRLDYTIPDWSQASVLSHVGWGALVALALGNSFTSASIATLIMSLAALVLFYILLRHLNVAPVYALFATAVLGFNPLYFNLSYSFMSEIPFLAYLLAACVCLVRGVQRSSVPWLLLGGFAAALAFLSRQFGILIVVAALVYLWWSRQWSWRRAAAVAVVPILTLIAYSVWEAMQPKPLVAYALDSVRGYMLHDPAEFVVGRLHLLATAVAIPGLTLLPMLILPRKPVFALVLAAPLGALLYNVYLEYGSFLPTHGHIIDNRGFSLSYLQAPTLWGEWVWAGLAITGVLVLSLVAILCGTSVVRWVREGLWRLWEGGREEMLLYILGVLITVAGVVAAPLLYDRYFLPLVALLIVGLARRLSITGSPNRVPAWRWLLLVPFALFSLLGMRDYMEHTRASWNLAERLAAQGIPRQRIDAGFEWQGWYLYQEGESRMRETGQYSRETGMFFPPRAVLDPEYVLSDLHLDGYNIERSAPYTSWLLGGQERRVLALKRK